MTPLALYVFNDEGTPFAVTIVRQGDRYGRMRDDGTRACVHDKPDPLVEFHDASQDPDKFGPLGQFVTRYYASTLLEEQYSGGFERDHGLDLMCHAPSWKLDGYAMVQVRRWLRAVTS